MLYEVITRGDSFTGGSLSGFARPAATGVGLAIPQVAVHCHPVALDLLRWRDIVQQGAAVILAHRDRMADIGLDGRQVEGIVFAGSYNFV